ncbi:hypothetical protein ACIP2X_11005 [Streptomyces sp. NPDC089424]|uniref:hypothetical protein n=1 Tax=Streptomyces sp. NPDC089424 TaxID=3365917 RepID=UPI003810EA90
MLMLAVLLLPGLSLLLIMMSRMEDKLNEDPRPGRHARRRRHLRLVHGGLKGGGRAAGGTGAGDTDRRTAAA